MVSKLRRDELAAEAATIAKLIEQLPAGAALTARSLMARRTAIIAELEALGSQEPSTGEAALFFGGAKVFGSRAIDADFAVRGIGVFQDLVARTVGERWRATAVGRPVPPDRELARLNIIGTVRGSFGFIIEEERSEQPELFPSAVKDALSSVAHILGAFSSLDEQIFGETLEEIEPRVLRSVRDFFKLLHDGEGTVRIVEGDRDTSLDRGAVERGYERAQQISVDEEMVELTGRLIGVLPVSRTFEFTRDDTGLTIKGKVGPQVSTEFLSRIESDRMPLGKRWRAKFRLKSVTRAGGITKETFILVDLSEDTQLI